MDTRRLSFFSAVSVLLIFVLAGCSFVPGTHDLQGTIALRVGDSSASRMVSVEDYDVISLDMEIYDPEGSLLWSEQWLADDGPQTYYIQVGQLGLHQIFITHNGVDGDATASATEDAYFNIASMMLSVINITPGAIGAVNVDGGAEQVCPLVGTWEGFVSMFMPEWSWEGDEGVIIGFIQFPFYAVMTYAEDGFAEMLAYELDNGEPTDVLIGDFSFRGTYWWDDDVLAGEWTHWYMNGTWEHITDWAEPPEIPPETSYPWVQPALTFSSDCNTLTSTFTTGDGMPEVTWVLHRVLP